MSWKSDITTESEQPRVIDSVTSTITPEQALESIDLTNLSTFIKTNSGSIESISNLDKKSDITESKQSQLTTIEEDPDYLIYLDRKNAILFKEFLIKFVKTKSEFQARDMVNMELINPDSVPESPDNHLAKLMAQALTLLKYENSEEKNQIMNLYTYYAERAKSFMFFLVSDLLKNDKYSEIRCDLKIVKTNAIIKNCRIAGINNILFLAVEIKINKSDPKNTSGEDLVSYVGISPYISLKGEDEDTTNDEYEDSAKEAKDEERSSILERTKQLVDNDEDIKTSRSEFTSKTKSTSPNKASFFDSNNSNDSNDIDSKDASIPYITSTRESTQNIDQNVDKPSELKNRVKNLILEYGNQRGGLISDKSTSKTPHNTTNPLISSTDSSNIIILKGGARKENARKRDMQRGAIRKKNIYKDGVHKGGTYISANAPQTEVDIKLQKLLEQSKPGKRGRFESTSSPMSGLCE